MSFRRSAAIIAGLVLAASLTGCAGRAGAAAVIGDEVISDRELSALVRESEQVADRFQLAGQVTTAEITASALTWLVRARLFERITAEEGISITDGEVDDVLASAEDDLGKDELSARLALAGVPPTRVREYARSFVANGKVLEALGQDSEALRRLLVDYSGRYKVEVAPRYGSWDTEQLVITSAVDDLSTPDGSLGGAAIVPQS